MLDRRSISINGVLISYLSAEGGKRGTVIFLHGWRSEAAAWSMAMTSMANDGFSVYAPDLPGFGNSESPRRAFSIRDYADIVSGFMEKLGLPHAVVAGHSFGGRIGIVLAAEHAPLVEKLVLVDAAGIREPSAGRDALALLAKIVKPLFSLRSMQPARRAVYRMLGAEDYVATPALAETFSLVVNEDLTPLLPKIAQETLLFWGEKDVDTPLSAGKLMQQYIPRATLAVVPGAGHFSFIDAPMNFFETLRSFAI